MIENRIESLRFSPVENVTTGTIATLSPHDTSMIFFTGAGAVTVESISYGAKGKVLKLANLTGSTLTLKHNTGSINKNRIITSDATDLVIQNNQIVSLLYDHVNSRWKIDGAASGGGGGGGTTETTRQFIYTSSPVNSNEYSNFNTLHSAALAYDYPCEIVLKENLTISTGNDWVFNKMVFVGNGSAVSPITFTIEDSTGTQATFDITAGSAIPADYLEHYISLYDDENVLSYIWFDTTGADPEPPGIIAATELKVRVDVQAIASADDVATAIQTAIIGDTYLNSKFTVTPTAAVAAFTLNFNGVSTLPVSTTANAVVGSFVNGVLGTTISSNSLLNIKNLVFQFKDYTNQRAWKVSSSVPSLYIEGTREGTLGYCAAYSTGCTIAPVLIQNSGDFTVAQLGLVTAFNISSTLFLEVVGGTVNLYPLDSLFGFGPANNITGNGGTVQVMYGTNYPQAPRGSFALSSYTGTLSLYSSSYKHVSDIDGINNLSSADALLFSTGQNSFPIDTAWGETFLGIGKAVDAYSDSNINIATLDSSVLIDGVSTLRVYLGAQTNPIENGVYKVTGTAPATRDFNLLPGSLYKINSGSIYAGRWVKNTNAGTSINFGTDDVTHEIVQVGKPITVTGTGTQPANLLLSSVFIVEPTGNITVDMSNPTPGFEYKFVMKQGGTAYTVAFTQTIEWEGGAAYTANTANTIDKVTIFYDGVNYYGDFKISYS